MKNKEGKYLIGILLILIVGNLLSMKATQSVEDFFLRNFEEATEILHQEEFEKNRHLLFYFDKEGYISCAVIKKNVVGYQILRTSGRFTLETTRYLCSFYEDQGDIKWVDWGIVADDTIEYVSVDGMVMNMIGDIPYGFRICWLTGSGAEPVNHIEGRIMI